MMPTSAAGRHCFQARLKDERSGLLEFLQLLLFMIVGAVGVVSSPRLGLQHVFEGLDIPLDFQTITLSYADVFMGWLLLISGLRAFLENAYRLRLAETVKLLLRPRYAALFVGFLALMSVGLFWAKQPSLLIASALHFAACLLMSFIGAALVREHGLSALWAIVLGGALQALIGLLQVINNSTLGLSALGEVPRPYYEPTTFFRASGLSMHANYLGGYLMLALFAALCLAVQARRRLGRILSGALGALCALGMLGTLSRSALLSTAIGSLPIAWIAWRALNRPARRSMLILSSAGVLIGIAFVLFATRGELVTRFFSGREFFFRDSWTVIQSAPLFGVGAGNLMYEVWLNVGMTPGPKLPVHNVYLYIWAETGLLGLTIFGAALLLNLSRLRPRYGAAHFIIGCGVLALAAVSLFDNYTWAVHPHRVLTFWWIGLWWGTTWHATDQSSSCDALAA
ncbi:MAG: hypothetical protein CUN49_07710 [Candidatus Thermofonsia Clade 1 bacterium]|uniref:O-antigen ligase-related domain-containing protein n=1 Tax=Candidatus Thermofonsia Clade 1 bacterium TaxID=2364210 RepID=A0A2M8PEL8_9CHLR|nr:MAG: hypothetical protein CUN49_07710 [Candidatus Thermofonsia Clade 1 bacterium]RMF53468.1 MAG: O-antigen ligase family protein [Chloroflexota bacterium]